MTTPGITGGKPKKLNIYREDPATGWRLKVQKFAFWSLLPLGYFLVFHYSELYNENMPFENMLATPRKMHDDFFRAIFGKKTVQQPEKNKDTPEPMGLRAVLNSQDKRDKAHQFLAQRQDTYLLGLVQRIEDKGLNRVRAQKGLPIEQSSNVISS